MPIARIYTDERGEPVARIVDEDGAYVVSLDVFAQLPSPPVDAEAVEISQRYKVYVKRRPLLRGVCELVYFQFSGGVQLINVKYVGPDDPDAALPELYKVYKEEAKKEKEESHGGDDGETSAVGPSARYPEQGQVGQ